MRQTVLFALALGLLGFFPGCDRGDDATPPIVIVTPSPVRGVIAETSYAPFEAGSWVAFPIPLSQDGKLDITVNWTNEDSWLYVYLGDVECTPQRLQDGTCPYLIESETKGPKPKVLESEILSPDTYYLYIHNVLEDPDTGVGSQNRESVRIVIGLTVGFGPQGASEPELQIGAPTIVSPSGL